MLVAALIYRDGATSKSAWCSAGGWIDYFCFNFITSACVVDTSLFERERCMFRALHRALRHLSFYVTAASVMFTQNRPCCVFYLSFYV